MTLERDALDAEQLLGNELLMRVLAQIERDAMETAVSAPLTDHELRASALAEVRAVRSFGSRLHGIIADAHAAKTRRGSPI